MTASNPSRPIAGLDGLRALAVILVILFHGKLLAAGWIGVQFFFVLSGFLITRVLLADRAESDSFGGYLGRFYARRALRIFPLYYAYLVLLTVAVLLVPAISVLAERLPAAWTYLLNFHMLGGGVSHSRLTDHLWSLAVEEQFYLVWPLLLAWVPAARRLWLVVALILAGPLLRLAAALPAPSLAAVFPLLDQCAPCGVYLLPTSHLDAFAWGAALNFLSWRPRPWHLLAALALLLGTGLAVNGLDRSLILFEGPRLALGLPLFMAQGWQSVWGYTLLNLCSFVLLSLVLHEPRVRRLFDRPWLDYVGKRSYGMYVLHFPIVALLFPVLEMLKQASGSSLIGTLLFQLPLLALTLAAAALSYRFLEEPLLNLRHRLRRPAGAAVPAAVQPQPTSG